MIEVQVREELYGTANQPTVIGKKDEQGNWLFPVKGALDSNDVAICIGDRLLKYVTDENLKGRVARLKEAQARLAVTQDVAVRIDVSDQVHAHRLPYGTRAEGVNARRNAGDVTAAIRAALGATGATTAGAAARLPARGAGTRRSRA